MLSIPTLWLVFVVNFLALSLVWTYVARSYPNFGAARYWAAGAYFACAGAALFDAARHASSEMVTIRARRRAHDSMPVGLAPWASSASMNGRSPGRPRCW